MEHETESEKVGAIKDILPTYRLTLILEELYTDNPEIIELDSSMLYSGTDKEKAYLLYTEAEECSDRLNMYLAPDKE
jgi:hypothetical protein